MVKIEAQLGGTVQGFIYFTISEAFPARVNGKEVLHLQRGEPYVWIVHPEYEEQFVRSVVDAGLVPVRARSFVCIPLPLKQTGLSAEYTSEGTR
jgi:hypothetical protein